MNHGSAERDRIDGWRSKPRPQIGNEPLVRRVFQLERSGASLLCVVAPVRLDNPNVVIDVMTRISHWIDDERVRANRLALLQTLLAEFSTIADFSEIVTEAK